MDHLDNLAVNDDVFIEKNIKGTNINENTVIFKEDETGKIVDLKGDSVFVNILNFIPIIKYYIGDIKKYENQ